MRTAACLLFLAAMALHALAAEPLREWTFPAMVYGPNKWSLVRITNKGMVAATVNVEAYRENGQRLEMPAEVLVEPGATSEIRIQPDGAAGLGWARVFGLKEATKSIKVEAVTEYLVGNKIEWLPRETAQISREPSKMMSPPEDAYLYLLNPSDVPMRVTICWTDRPNDVGCLTPTTPPSHTTIAPRQVLFGGLGHRKGRYFVARMDQGLPSAMLYFAPTHGRVKTFSTETNLSFDEDADAKPAESARGKK